MDQSMSLGRLASRCHTVANIERLPLGRRVRRSSSPKSSVTIQLEMGCMRSGPGPPTLSARLSLLGARTVTVRCMREDYASG
jgi:hypothetical protein